MPPGTLSQENRGRWTAGKATWNAFAGIPCQVGGGKGHLERFHGDSVAGGQRERTPGTLSRGYRGKWAVGKDTWNDFAEKPCQVGGREMPSDTLLRGFPWQVGSKRCYLERFRGDSVPGGRQRRTPGTLLREFRGRWAAGKDT